MKISEDTPIIYDVLTDQVKIEDTINETTAENVFLIGANNDLAGLEIEFARAGNWEMSLKNKIGCNL